MQRCRSAAKAANPAQLPPHSPCPSLPAHLPPISHQPGGSPQLVVGCLDINQGAVLPAEQLVGKLPPEGDRGRLRAYLSNVAVWEGARRRGVARRLIEEAMRQAAAAGVQHLYGERMGGEMQLSCQGGIKCCLAVRASCEWSGGINGTGATNCSSVAKLPPSRGTVLAPLACHTACLVLPSTRSARGGMQHGSRSALPHMRL